MFRSMPRRPSCSVQLSIECLEERRLLTGLPAFPGAEGFGGYATGGRGGTVYHVTNLNDSGPGSFRDAVSHTNRIIVFDVGGYINLSSAVSAQSNLSIEGQTAPGDGIGVMGREVSFAGRSNVIVRYFRFRQGSLDPDSTKNSISLLNATNIILDHVSMEFGRYNDLDAVGARNITIQNSIIADPIGQQFNAHTETGPFTWVNDIFANAHNRNPLAKDDTQFVNNVVYNYQAGYTAANTSGIFSHDLVGNYFISGPSTTSAGDAFYQMNGQRVYISDNWLDSNRDGHLNGSLMGYPGGTTHLSSPWSDLSSLAIQAAADAFAYDVANAGDSLVRDAVDSQVIADVTSLGRSGHLWTSQTQTGLPNNGYGTLNGGPGIVDSDGDGMPDGWEAYYGLDPTQHNANGDFDGTGYTNIEKYVNSIVDNSYPYLPSPWADGDVGNVGLPGVANDVNGNFVVQASGAGVGGTNDEFHFVYQGVSGDGSIVAQVLSQTNTNGRAEAGLMFRNSLDDTSAYAEADVTPDGHVFFTWRTNDGGTSSYAVAYAHAPVWLELDRAGNTFTASYSSDGATFTPVASHAVNLAPDALVGLAVSSHDDTTLETAAFANVATSWDGGTPPALIGDLTSQPASGAQAAAVEQRTITNVLLGSLKEAADQAFAQLTVLPHTGPTEDTSTTASSGMDAPFWADDTDLDSSRSLGLR